jgi:uncharacterized protein (UPF0332 family)
MSDLLAKANGAARSARILFDAGEFDGAISRAYYAMFDLARVVLKDIDPKLAVAKTHSTIIARFSKHLAQNRNLQGHGRALRQAFDARVVADYADLTISREEAARIIDLMEKFFAALAPDQDRE